MKFGSMNVVGCGRLGQAITRLMIAHELVENVYVCNRSRASGDRAVTAIGAGIVCDSIAEMPPGDLWLVSCVDQEISAVANQIATQGSLSAPSIAFHCSGVVSSDALMSLRSKGVQVASIHPIRSFANVELTVRDFKGTFCAVEGDPPAVGVLTELFTTIGGQVFPIPTEAKMMCHAGHVFASNYLVALLECAHRLYRAAGVPEELSWKIMEPLVRGTVDNVTHLGPVKALTGPISRGEELVVRQQMGEVARIDPLLGELYATLGRVTLEIAQGQGLSGEKNDALQAVLSAPRAR